MRKTVNERIKELEEQIHAQEAYIAASKFMPPDEEFQKVSKMKSELFQLYDDRDKGRGNHLTPRIYPYQ